MTERIPSDHDTLESHRVRLTTVGRTGRYGVVLPDGLSVGAGDIVSISLEGTIGMAQVETTLRDDPTVRGVFDNRRLARTPGDGADRLVAWIEETGLREGDQLLLDVLTTGYAYGLRRPGERIVYEAPKDPDSSLTDIARDLGE